MNVELLEAIKVKILAEPSQFDMENFFHTDKENIPNCGTAACIGGWAIALKLGVTPNEAQYRRTTGETDWRRSAECLDLPYRLAYRLFYTDEWPREFESAWVAAYDGPNHVPLYAERAEIACQRIDHFIETGE